MSGPAVPPVLATVLLTVLGAGLAAGCGAGTPGMASTPLSPAPTSASARVSAPPSTPVLRATRVTARPVHGDRIEGQGYAFRIPRGWRDVTGSVDHRGGVDRAAGARVADHGFNSNVNVVVTPGALTPAQTAQVAHSIEQRIRPTAPSYAVLRPVLIAGEHAGHLAGLRSRANPPYWLEQYVVSHGARAYVVSFSFSRQVPSGQRRRVIDGVLASWTWR